MKQTNIFAVLAALSVVGCTSTPDVGAPQISLPTPPAEIMERPQPLNPIPTQAETPED